MSREIPLAGGFMVIVDEDDYNLVSQFTWTAKRRPHTTYAKRRIYREDGSETTQMMHRLIMQPTVGQQVDHIDGNGLNNTRANLRITDDTGNQRNKRRPRNNTSGYKGVSWHKRQQKWQVQCSEVYVGSFDCPVEAAKAYDKAALQMHGEFCNLNFPPL